MARTWAAVIVGGVLAAIASREARAAAPVTPGASAEAVALLQLLTDLSGKQVLSGQHNFPNTGDKSTQEAAAHAGKTPAVYSQDWGFARDGDKDSYLARPAVIEEVKRQHALGSIITICWHAVPPTADEPVVFRQRGRQAPAVLSSAPLSSVQGQLTDEQFRDVLTPGTALHGRWCAQVDVIAECLKQLQAARVPVLWRPYHEMNGGWFWWGGRRTGEFTTRALYRQLFDRYVNHHQLKNLVWVWSVDRSDGEDRQFVDYFPGEEKFDVASLDCYGEFKQTYYEELVKLAGEKPVVLGEVGQTPVPEVLAKQPRWGLYVVWAGMARRTPREEARTLVSDPRVWGLDDAGYREAIAPLRAAGGLEPLATKGDRPRSGRRQ